MFPYIYRWRKAMRFYLTRYHNKRCRVLARGKLNSALVEFASGERAIISRNALRKIKE